ncbi:hypothetical protein D3C76_1391100 [compost metagenome]
MFPRNSEVLKIPARSTLLYAKSLVTTMASTSATLPAKRWAERGFDYFRACLRMVFTDATVDIFFRYADYPKIAQTL